MPTTASDTQKVQNMRNEAAAKNLKAAEYESTAFTLEDQIMSAVREDRVGRGVSQMAEDVGNTMGQMATDPADIRERGGDMINPLRVDALTARARGQNLDTLGTIATQADRNYGTLQEIIQAGANQLVARGRMSEAEAANITAEANSLTEKYAMDFEERKFQEQIRQFNETLAEKQRSGSGKKEEPEEQRPLYTPMQGDGAVSEGGEYIYYQGQWYTENELEMLNAISIITKRGSGDTPGVQPDGSYIGDGYKILPDGTFVDTE